jgi:hypothetical protein
MCASERIPRYFENGVHNEVERVNQTDWFDFPPEKVTFTCAPSAVPPTRSARELGQGVGRGTFVRQKAAASYVLGYLDPGSNSRMVL